MKLYKESWFQRKGKWGYGEIGRRYGLDCIEPWYGNLLSGNKKWAILSQIPFLKKQVVLKLEPKGKG
jgi:hypothetical protein